MLVWSNHAPNADTADCIIQIAHLWAIEIGNILSEIIWLFTPWLGNADVRWLCEVHCSYQSTKAHKILGHINGWSGWLCSHFAWYWSAQVYDIWHITFC